MELAEVEIVCMMKDTVRFTVLYKPVYDALPIIKQIVKKNVGISSFLLTSGNDSQHGKPSYHDENLAFDVRTRGWTAMQIQNVLRDSLAALRAIDPHWDVVFEPDAFNTQGQQIKWQHLHFEFDRRKKV